MPIWIGTIEAVSIAYAQEGFVHPRPQTHDLLIDIVESLNATISEVCITDIQDKTYFAEITLNTLEVENKITQEKVIALNANSGGPWMREIERRLKKQGFRVLRAASVNEAIEVSGKKLL